MHITFFFWFTYEQIGKNISLSYIYTLKIIYYLQKEEKERLGELDLCNILT